MGGQGKILSEIRIALQLRLVCGFFVCFILDKLFKGRGRGLEKKIEKRGGEPFSENNCHRS